MLNALPAIRAGRRHAIPVVYEVRALWEDAAASHGTAAAKPGLRYRATRLIETRALRRADAVTTICEGLRDDAIARGVPGEKITVIPNAVDRNTFSGPGAPDRALAARLGLCGKTVLAFFGSFYAYEGLHLLLRAVPDLQRQRRRDRRSARRRRAGRRATCAPSPANSTSATASSLPDGSRIEEMRRYYDLADLFVFPRVSMRLTELVTPLKPLEAMAQERIVVASSVGGHRELIRDRETGYLFPPDEPQRLAEGVLAALADRASWPRIRARAIDFIDTERSWAHSVARYAEVYAASCGIRRARCRLGRGPPRKSDETARFALRSCSASRIARRSTGCGTRRRRSEELADRGGEPARRDIRHDASGLGCGDDIGDAADFGDDDRGAASHAFQQHVGPAFVASTTSSRRSAAL